MSPDWRYHFEVDQDLDADDKRWHRWKAQGLRFEPNRPRGRLTLWITLLGALGLVLYTVLR